LPSADRNASVKWISGAISCFMAPNPPLRADEVVAQRLMIFDYPLAESFAFVKFRDAVCLVNRERIEDERNPMPKVFSAGDRSRY
jgi:hypothetical protein